MPIGNSAAPFLIYQKIMEDLDIRQMEAYFVEVILRPQMMDQQLVWTFPVDPGQAATTRL